jgi:hypothetical protein
MKDYLSKAQVVDDEMTESQKNELRELMRQRDAAIDELVKGLEGKIGKPVPDDALISILIVIGKELGNLYRITEMEINVMMAIQKNIEVVALEAFNVEKGDEQGANDLINSLQNQLEDVIRNTSKSWENQ